jgi:serine/threonine-protein kinase Chk2
MDLPATLDVIDGYIPEEEESATPWGRLLPMGKGFTSIELAGNEYTFGRDPSCDYSFSSSVAADTNPHIQAFSKLHFKVVKEDSSNLTVFLEDKSSNGTFVNGEKVGKNKKVPLRNNDEISLALPKNKAFVFMETNITESESAKLPEVFREKYMMSKVLGRGACGEVKLAFERETCRKFAVKCITKKTFSVGPRLGPGIMDEVKILKELSHPCIIEIEDVFESNDMLYIVLELVEGGELFDRVVGIGKFTEPQAKLLFYQMLIAVKYLHDRNITHRDLKPENILLSSEANETLIKVTDFGVSRFVGETSLMKTLCGTPTYLAPEVLTSAGMAGYSKAVDCWSLGVILFICLGGYPPFSDEIEEHSLKDQITKGIYSFPKEYWKDVSSDAIDLIKKLLTVDPKKRISTAQALDHKWMKVIFTRPSTYIMDCNLTLMCAIVCVCVRLHGLREHLDAQQTAT